jgi:hypothetical protein
MANITRYLQQTCVWERRQESTDGFGNWTYEPPQTIRCRHTTKTKQVAGQKERTHVDVTIYWTIQEIAIGDRINGEEIMARQNVVDRMGIQPPPAARLHPVMGDASSFLAGIERLEEKVGQGLLTGKLKVNQHYALDQHENFSYEHPRGGGPKYLAGPLMAMYPLYLAWLQVALLEYGLANQMALNMEDLSDKLDPAAPIDESPNPIRLRRSGHPIVIDNGEIVYDRAPLDPREPFIDPDDEDRAVAAESNATPTF